VGQTLLLSAARTNGTLFALILGEFLCLEHLGLAGCS
jgi:hypothetical protein